MPRTALYGHGQLAHGSSRWVGFAVPGRRLSPPPLLATSTGWLPDTAPSCRSPTPHTKGHSQHARVGSGCAFAAVTNHGAGDRVALITALFTVHSSPAQPWRAPWGLQRSTPSRRSQARRGALSSVFLLHARWVLSPLPRTHAHPWGGRPDSRGDIGMYNSSPRHTQQNTIPPRDTHCSRPAAVQRAAGMALPRVGSALLAHTPHTRAAGGGAAGTLLTMTTNQDLAHTQHTPTPHAWEHGSLRYTHRETDMQATRWVRGDTHSHTRRDAPLAAPAVSNGRQAGPPRGRTGPPPAEQVKELLHTHTPQHNG
jgi:hypothetical protein